MRELLIASRHRFERLTYHKTAQPNSSNGERKSIIVSVSNKITFLFLFQEFFFTQDQKSKQLQETLAHSQEALIIQILLDILHKFKKVLFFGKRLNRKFFSSDVLFTGLSRITRRCLRIHPSNVYQQSRFS